MFFPLSDFCPSWVSFPLSKPYLANLLDLVSMSIFPLLFQADAQPLLVKRFTRYNLFVDGHSSLSHWIVNRGRRVMTFPRYQNVAHLAFLTARFMGADPIIFVGLDLSFPKKQAHASDCTSPWGLDDCRGLLQKYPGTDGGQVQTLDSFISYIHIFEQKIKKTGAHCLNCSEHGALIQGTTAMPLSRALALKNPDARLKAAFLGLFQNYSSNPSPDLKRHYRESLQWLLEQSRSVARLCLAAEIHLKKAADSTITLPHPPETLNTLCALQQKIFAHKAFLDIVSDYLAHYLLSFHRIPEAGLPPVDISRSSDPSRQLNLFYEELSRLLPHLENRIPPVLKTLE